MNAWRCVKMFVWMTVITGIIYPLLITTFAHVTFKDRAEGGFVVINGTKKGAGLIAQKFITDKYFWPRPSAVDYNPLPSGGSNLGPTSSTLKKQINERKQLIQNSQAISNTEQIPSELLYASGSGLDPHISIHAALFQVERIVKARNFNPLIGKKKLQELIENMTEERYLGFIGERCVNVLLLNVALDTMEIGK